MLGQPRVLTRYLHRLSLIQLVETRNEQTTLNDHAILTVTTEHSHRCRSHSSESFLWNFTIPDNSPYRYQSAMCETWTGGILRYYESITQLLIILCNPKSAKLCMIIWEGIRLYRRNDRFSSRSTQSILRRSADIGGLWLISLSRTINFIVLLPSSKRRFNDTVDRALALTSFNIHHIEEINGRYLAVNWYRCRYLEFTSA